MIEQWLLGCARFAEILSEHTKTWSSGVTECRVWIGNCNVKVWKSTEHKLYNIWRSVKFQQNEHTPGSIITRVLTAGIACVQNDWTRSTLEQPWTAVYTPLRIHTHLTYHVIHMMYMSPTIHDRDNEFGILTVVSSLSPECDFEFEIF